jgi:hypothetical protein
LINWVVGRKKEPGEYGEIDPDVRAEIEETGPTNVAAILLRREDLHRDQETSRIRLLRIVSIFVGTGLAYLLQIDAFDYLEQAVPGISQFNFDLVTGDQLSGFWPRLSSDLDITVGIVLTGLAASAGSKFWRDLLGRLQATKQQAESAASLLRKGKAMLGMEEESR